MPLDLDPTDLRILAQLQRDSALSNQALAEAVHVSAATALRRVRRLVEGGVIERQVAVLAPAALGSGVLCAVVEVTLETQGAAALEAFESLALAEPAVQQCYRVSSGPDFVLVVATPDMAAYHALAGRLSTPEAGVRNVRTYFSVKRVKFGTELPLP